ncbi:MAG: UvrB/UvrC motif-containing protein [Candidatus Omnitrophica bacterium]|nr:UvrB/UvrC motif-containing protein [Candidatus Omnitrophota bacterium]
MKCDKCSKKATVHLTEIVDGKAMEMHLCEECARDQGQQMEQQFGLGELLAGLTDFGKHVPEVQKNVIQCPACGLTYEDFRKFGRFGCAQCYVAFKPQLKTLLKKIHGSSAHLGKKPEKYVDLQPKTAADVAVASSPAQPEVETVDTLRVKMLKAIDDEDFELAARLRDRIREIEQGG